MDKLLAPLNGQTSGLDESSRLKLQDSLREAADNLETPYDTMLRFLNAGRQLAMIKIGCDLRVFKTLAAATSAISVEKLAEPFGADPLLITRIMRFLAANRLVTETSKDCYAANKHTKALADPRIEGGLLHAFAISTPTYQALPEYLVKNNYQNLTGGHCAWNSAFSTDLDFFPWAKSNPDILGYFQQLMSVPREGNWLDVMGESFEVAASSISKGQSEETVQNGADERALFVDIGGNIGHQCARLKARYPELKGKVVLQDREETIARAPKIEGVEFMVHDFFTEQPVKAAKFYYLRAILHDWEDDKSARILQSIIPAMAPDSVILIDDLALPNTGTHWWSTCIDMQMYIMHGAMERNMDQWHALLDKAGLRMLECKVYSPVMRNAIIVAVPKGREGVVNGNGNGVVNGNGVHA